MFRTRVKIRNNSKTVNRAMNSKCKMASRLILEDIHRTANKTTPYKAGDLREQVSKRIEGSDGVIEWRQPYAAYQERGSRADGSHQVRNYTTPGTGPHFAAKAVEEVVNNNIAKYFGQL